MRRALQPMKRATERATERARCFQQLPPQFYSTQGALATMHRRLPQAASSDQQSDSYFSIAGMLCTTVALGSFALLEQHDQHQYNLSACQIKKLAALINGVVDLPDLSEEEEQEIFEHSVTLIIDRLNFLLPMSYWKRMQTRNDSIREHEKMRDRIAEVLRESISLPFLDELDERQVMHATVEILVEALAKDVSLQEILDNGSTNFNFIGIFIRGALGFLGPTDRTRLEETFSSVVALPDGIPFITTFKNSLVRKILDEIQELLQTAIMMTLHEAFSPDQSKAISNMESQTSSILATQVRNGSESTEKTLIATKSVDGLSPEFINDAQVHFVSQLKDNIVDLLNERINFPFFTEAKERELFRSVVDVYFECPLVDTRKISAAVELLANAQKKNSSVARSTDSDVKNSVKFKSYMKKDSKSDK